MLPAQSQTDTTAHAQDSADHCTATGKTTNNTNQEYYGKETEEDNDVDV